MELHVYPTPDEVIKGLADFFTATVNAALEKKGRCNLVLSGGSSPKKLYQLLASASYQKKINWSNVFFFFGDERYVPFTDKNNNGRMAQESLFEPLHIAPSNIFYINTGLEPPVAAADYQHRILQHFDGGSPAFDLILLGLGDNAHTASLFPHTQVLQAAAAEVSAVWVHELQSWRISMTAPMINEASSIVFLVYGASKKEAVQHILSGEKDTAEYPAQLIQANSGNIHWFMDNAAADLLV